MRKKPGAASFAAAWDRALACARYARIVRAEAPPPPPPRLNPAAVAAMRPDSKAFEALLDRLYPGTVKADEAHEAGKGDKADRR